MALAGICNACMDTIRYHWTTSIFFSLNTKYQQWFRPTLSWRNKWKNGDPNEGERFLGSSTVFVWLTDFRHFAKLLMLLFISLAIVFYHPVYEWWTDIPIMYITFTGIFELFFSKILT